MSSIDLTTQTIRSRSGSPKPKATRKDTRTGGIEVERYFTKPGVDVYDTCEWELRSAVITNERGGQVPSIDTRSVETQVLVNNGQTVVLGGIYETEQSEDQSKVPFLGDIPLIGYLFRSTSTVSTPCRRVHMAAARSLSFSAS